MIESLFILILTAAACSILGVFLVLRNLSMIADAISHSVLLGIVLALFIVRNMSSPLLVIGASIFGVLTVIAIELLIKSGLIKNDAAVGIVFPLFFSIGVILISRYARGIHLDTDCVLMGEIIFAPLNRIEVFGISMPKAFLQMGSMLLINASFVIVFFKELSINTFDSEYASLNGFSATVLLYSLMSLVSVTAVSAFDSVGAILVIAFMITPAASAFLLTKRLKNTIILAVLIGALDSILGYYISVSLNLSMAGVTAFVMGVVFILILIFHQDGIIMHAINRRKNKKLLTRYFFINHLFAHQDNKLEEHGVETMHRHVNRTYDNCKKICKSLIAQGLASVDDEQNIYVLSEKGKEVHKDLEIRYGLR